MNASLPDIVDSKGMTVPLGGVLGKGGEGTVYEVRRYGNIAAKVYHTPLSDDRSAKIGAMVKIGSAELSAVAAWPIDLLISRTTRKPVGLLMPRIEKKKNVHHVYGPKSRLKDFPKADWRFLVRTAANTARAFSSVHETMCVIGDVNHGSIMVAEDATVTLIDCDSFQVTTPNRKFFCDVGIETFTPPELQGKPFRGAERTANYDNFGLAVVIFHLLFMGRHPFAGRYLGVGEMPIAKAIKECRFPYGSQHRAMQMEPPPGTVPLGFVGAEVAQLFERAFARAGIDGTRPKAREWATALAALEKDTKQCAISKSHWYPVFSSHCPWCQMEGQGANPLFPFVLPSGMAAAGVDVEALWRAFQNLENPGNAPVLNVPELPPSAEVAAISKSNDASKGIAIAVAICVLVGGIAWKPAFFWIFGIAAFVAFQMTRGLVAKDREIHRFRNTLSEAEAAARVGQADWERQAGGAVFYEARSQFLSLKAEFDGIPGRRSAALGALKTEMRQRQLNRFLETFEIEDAQIDGVGPSRKRLLESYGIEAADDVVVSRLQGVPGFGPVMINRLIKWRKSIESKFVFNPTMSVDPRDVARVELEILTARSQLQTSVKNAYAQTLQAHAELMRIRATKKQPLEQLLIALGQARADVKLLNKQH